MVAPLSVAMTRQRRRAAIRYWEKRARHLDRLAVEPFHMALVEEMDKALDLFRRGDWRFSEPLEVAALVRDGARVAGHLAHEQALARKPDPDPEPWPMGRLAAFQTQN